MFMDLHDGMLVLSLMSFPGRNMIFMGGGAMAASGGGARRRRAGNKMAR